MENISIYELDKELVSLLNIDITLLGKLAEYRDVYEY